MHIPWLNPKAKQQKAIQWPFLFLVYDIGICRLCIGILQKLRVFYMALIGKGHQLPSISYHSYTQHGLRSPARWSLAPHLLAFLQSTQLGIASSLASQDYDSIGTGKNKRGNYTNRKE